MLRKLPAIGKIVLTSMLTTVHTVDARAEGNGPQLYAMCVNVEKTSPRDQICNVYLSGISEGIFVGLRVAQSGFRTCLPKATALDIKLVREIVEKFMREQPTRINQHASTLVFEALATAFPCKAGPRD
jgi:hypothetical protein